MRYICRYIDEISDVKWGDTQVGYLREVVSADAPRLETRFQACWTMDSLHIRYECEDDYVVSTMTQRDDPLYEEDVVEVFLDPFGGGTTYYEFEVSPRGVLFDALIHNRLDGNKDVVTSWIAEGFQAEVTQGTDKGWFVYDVRIPFADLDEAGVPHSGTVWHWNVFRIDDDRDGVRHYSAWSPTGKVNFHIPQQFGELVFVKE
ncbi:carbohydrate-binding family 9-like protein [Paenibacillus sp. LjRoot153]|uniref:carbohydrate-binding family 9-like protein n=1 Tax=Paenibacillus sp. LjRoot153 TaxID=3342270 RepID=UPI003ECECC36